MPVIAGVGRADLTPPVGIMQSGYAARQTGSEAIHDDLTATVLYLAQEGLEMALVGLDLIMFEAAEVAEIRRCCQELTGVPGDRIMVACTHTHSGPVTGPGEDDGLRAAYATALRWQIAGALREAKLRAQPVQLAATRQPLRLAGNRRERTPQGTILGYNPDAPTPTAADVLRVESADGALVAAVVVYDCHGTTLGPDNMQLSADYPGYARRFLEAQAPGLRAMILGGCGANQNPYPRGTFAWAERHGQSLGAAAYLGLLDMPKCRPVARLAVEVATARLPLEPLPTLDECRAQLAAVEATAARERGETPEEDSDRLLSWTTRRQLRQARARVAAAEAGDTDLALTCEIQVLALDDLAFVALPGEIFFEIGQAIRAQSPFAVTLPLGWSNGSIGYVPTQTEVPFGGYEIEMARAHAHGLLLREDGDAALIAATVAALRAAHRSLR